MLREAIRSSVLGLTACTFALGQLAPQNTASQGVAPQANGAQTVSSPGKQQVFDLDNRPSVSEKTRMQLIQSINAEFVRVRKTLPLGYRAVTLNAEGEVKPGDARLYQLAQSQGSVAKIGDRVQITNIAFKQKAIYLEVNGGPKKKGHWYDHVQVGVGGAGGGISNPEGDQGKSTGSGVTLEFKKHVPEMTGPELRQLLAPVLDFSMRSGAEVYVETLPPKVQEAVKKHEVLVGMNRDMVIAAKERPDHKSREKDGSGKEFEDWVYGTPPHDVTFVRFVGDEVTMVKIAKVGQETVTKTQKEIDVNDGVVSMAAIHAQGKDPQLPAEAEPPREQPKRAPTLRREGEEPDPAFNLPIDTHPQHKAEPEWGSDGQEKPPKGQDQSQGQQPDQQQQQPKSPPQ